MMQMSFFVCCGMGSVLFEQLNHLWLVCEVKK